MSPASPRFRKKQQPLLPLATAPRHRTEPASAPSAAPDIRAQFCAFCRSDKAWFGYGPPLVRVPFWACRNHRVNAEASTIAGTSPHPRKPLQGD
jgi:hypothetical protein